MAYRLTAEQEAVIAHPPGNHARVLAVAGSGKTTTLGYRIIHLIQECQVNPGAIRVLMFNRLARKQFQNMLFEIGLADNQHPEVHTFHSFAFRFLQKMRRRGLLAVNLDYWLDGKAEMARRTAHRAIFSLKRTGRIPEDSEIEVDEVIEAINLWKGSLIPPDRAGYHGNELIPLVYKEFEKLRIEKGGLSYADFIPLAVDILEAEEEVNAEYRSGSEYLIVDEYQDVNYGQQRLIELLAGISAEIMVVGDDDQTIYEWRGARPNYIIHDFPKIFNTKPSKDYLLSYSFRFGPVLAQCASNVIRHNTNRYPKLVAAHQPGKGSTVNYLGPWKGSQVETNNQLGDQLIHLVKQQGIAPSSMIVLCRMFAQLSGIQAALLARSVPFRIDGQSPFYERHEVQTLLDYVRLAKRLEEPMGDNERQQFLRIVNVPSRKLGKKDLAQACQAGMVQGFSTLEILKAFIYEPQSPFNSLQKDRISDLQLALQQLQLALSQPEKAEIGGLLSWLVDRINYLSHFENYFGKGEESLDRKLAIQHFISYATSLEMIADDFLEHLESLDTGRGAPEEEQIVLTTIFRTKGLEFDYVFIPDCLEGFMPCLYSSTRSVYDLAGEVVEPEPSAVLENERRLFYVGVTRAKEGVFIGAGRGTGPSLVNNEVARNASRFMEEIELQATEAIMIPLQEALSGTPGAQDQLHRGIKEQGGAGNIIETLRTKYLNRISDRDLSKKIDKWTRRIQPKAFAYKQTYPEKVMKERKLHSSWDDVKY